MQRAEMEELRQRDANMTALQAIGPRKKMKIDSKDTTTGGAVSSIVTKIRKNWYIYWFLNCRPVQLIIQWVQWDQHHHLCGHVLNVLIYGIWFSSWNKNVTCVEVKYYIKHILSDALLLILQLQ